jgi:type I restriction enzyme R subunit
MIEAKRRSKNVAGAIAQAERYARGYSPEVPFVFATNGRGYLKQLETESGIWFRDTRKS